MLASADPCGLSSLCQTHMMITISCSSHKDIVKTYEIMSLADSRSEAQSLLCHLPLLSTLQTFFVSLCSHNSIPRERRVSCGNLRRLVLCSHPPSFLGVCSLTAQGAPRNWGAGTSSHLLTLQTGALFPKSSKLMHY